MQLHEIQPSQKKKARKRKGKGKKHGMYSGRGIKGQKARAGHKLQPIIRRLVKKYHKKRGYRFNAFRPKPEVVTIKRLEQVLSSGTEVTPEILLEEGMVRRQTGRVPSVKIVGDGELTKKLTIKDCRVSKGAQEIIEKAGGSIIDVQQD